MTEASAAAEAAAIICAPMGASGGTPAMISAVTDELEDWFAGAIHGTARACTFTDTGDLVGLVGHGFTTDDRVVFASIVSTTGLTAGTEYFVRSAGLTADAFTVAATAGGAAVALTTNGTGTVAPSFASSAEAQAALPLAAKALPGESAASVKIYAAQLAAAAS